MSLIGVIIGTISQLILAWPLLLFAGVARFGLFTILPLSCLVSSAIVIYLYNHGGTSASYLWYGLPPLLMICVLILMPK